MIKEAIQLLVDKKDLTERQAADVMREIMSQEATDAQIAAFAVALRMKGETVDEITGCARVMREKAVKIKTRRRAIPDGEPAVGIDRDEINVEDESIVDTCGTGGDKTKTFNVSTATAFVVAGAGVTVAKHGNRAVSSACGSADVLEKLGLNLDVTPEKVEECLSVVGIGFLYAPMMHGAMKHAAGPRRQIGIRTIFNILGPLTNPASANAQVLGVYAPELTEKLAMVLGKLGARRAFVVHGMDSTDEISVTGVTRVSELSGGGVRTYRVTPDNFGVKRAKPEDIKGGDSEENASIILAVLKGEKGPRRDIVLINSSAALVAACRAPDFASGVKLAEQSIDSGGALRKLESLREMCGK